MKGKQHSDSPGGWSCPHNINTLCDKVGSKLTCKPGMKGCIIQGTVTFSEPTPPEGFKPEEENKPLHRRY